MAQDKPNKEKLRQKECMKSKQWLEQKDCVKLEQRNNFQHQKLAENQICLWFISGPMKSPFAIGLWMAEKNISFLWFNFESQEIKMCFRIVYQTSNGQWETEWPCMEVSNMLIVCYLCLF